MKIFISWSGDHARAIAEVLRTWIDDVFETATPFMSQADIEGGSRPLQRIETELENARFGVVVVTKANQHAPWITFEAGALSKVIDDAGQYVMPMLVDLRISDLTGPLTQFQAAILDYDGTKKLVQSIGKVLGLEDPYVERKFETYWPQLEGELKKVPAPVEHAGEEKAGRPSGDVLDEILTIVRALRSDGQKAPAPTGGWVRDNIGEARWPAEGDPVPGERGLGPRSNVLMERDHVLQVRAREVAAAIRSFADSQGVGPGIVEFRMIAPRRVELILTPGFSHMVPDPDEFLRGLTQALAPLVKVTEINEYRHRPPHRTPFDEPLDEQPIDSDDA